MTLEFRLAGQEHCSCGQLTRRVLELWGGPKKVLVAKKDTIGGHAGGFTMLHDSHYASDGMCWRCSKPEEYLKAGGKGNYESQRLFRGRR